MFAGVSRAGPSGPTIQQTILKTGAPASSPISQQWRCMAKASQTAPAKRKSAGFNRTVKRDDQGQIIQEKKEKSLGAFRPFPIANLGNPTFESDRRSILKLPAFAPTRSMLGLATEFPTLENDPARIYGLPKKMLLEFRILSKPCSVVRDITVKTVELLDKAKEMSSLDTRVVLSTFPS
ncbi:hypothetical protein FPV67DRAFT_1681679 [Lyophyllum atratum]|nr:hypothetical protein FPV67DRAFT_1681679 [Lyophyllum atratum]